MSWFGAVPVGLMCVVWLLVPGLPATYGAGLRGVAAWATAPIVTVAVTAALAVVAQKAGIAWSVPLVVVVFAVLAVLTGVISFLVRRRAPARSPDPRSLTAAAALGLVPAAILGAIAVAHGFGEPDSLSQTFDAVFHYNAVASVVDSRDASSLTLGSLGTPGLPGTFYPGAWHDLVSLVVLSTGTAIPVATNLLAATVALLIWPLSCLFLVRQVFGRSSAALAVTGVLSLGFGAYPWGLLSFGVLWPNLLGMSLAPAALAVVLSVCGVTRDDALGRGRAWLLMPVTAVALGLAHPNVLFSLIVLSIFPVATALIRRTGRLRRENRLWRGILEILVALAIFFLGWWWAATTPAFEKVRTFYWAPITTVGNAVWQVLRNATNNYDSLWLLSALVLVGVVVCLWKPGLRWLVAGELVAGAFYVLTAAVNTPSTQKFTGYWYNDSHRLAAVVPITAVPLAVAAVLFLTTVVRRGLPKAAPVLVAAGLTAVILAVTGGLYVSSHIHVLAGHYTEPAGVPGRRLLDPRERAFFDRIKNEIPQGVRVAGNPWDGSVLLWALEDRKTVFGHLDIATTPDQKYLAAHLIDATTDPEVCAAANRLQVRYLVIGETPFSPDSAGVKEYPGFADPGSRPGFQLVDSDGPLKLYRLTACAR